VDIIFAHRPDFEAPLEETVRAFSWLIDQGLAFYWGTSEWPVEMTSRAIQYAQSHGLHAPVTEQPQYNMLSRDRFESEYSPLFERYNYGSTVWSPLAQGVLSGRFNDGNK
jgi:aryl-alcohol dehydrogenase-like predicted oxidoreductase